MLNPQKVHFMKTISYDTHTKDDRAPRLRMCATVPHYTHNKFSIHIYANERDAFYKINTVVRNQNSWNT